MRLKQGQKQAITSFLWRSLQVFNRSGVTFVLFFMSAKLLTPVELGLFCYLMAAVGVLIILCDFGLSIAVSKFVAEYIVRQPEKLSKVLFSVSGVAVASSTLITVMVVLFGNKVFGDNYRYILYFTPCLFFMPLNSIADGLYRGLKQFRKLAIVSSVVGIVSLALSAVLISRLSLIGAVLAQDVLYFLLAVFLYVFSYKMEFRFDWNILKEVTKYAFVLGIASLSYFLYTRVDILILKQFGFVVEIGYYEIVNRVFQVLLITFIILGEITAPNVTEYMTVGNIPKIIDILKKYAAISVCAGVGLSVFLYLSIPFVLEKLLPEYYTPNFLLIVKILLMLLPFKIWGVLLTQALVVPCGFAKITATTTLVCGILNVFLDYALINLFGFVGVFWSTLVVHSLATVVTTVYYCLKLNREAVTLRMCGTQTPRKGLALRIAK